MENKFYSFSNEIQILYETDVAVIGGGTAGAFAAISSAIEGAKTILIEKSGILGGTMTNGGVNFPGLFHAWGKQIISGPCWEAVKYAVSLDNGIMPAFEEKPERHWHHQIRVNAFTFAAVLDKMCEENNVQLMLHTMPAFFEETDDGIYIVCAAKEGLFCIKAKIVVDATGDANAAGCLGYKRLRSEALQPATLINKISGYNINEIDKDNFMECIKNIMQSGELQSEDFQGANPYDLIFRQSISMHITDVDASDSAGKANAEIKARKKLLKIITALKKIQGLGNLQVDFIAPECGIRETYRIDGEVNITSEDYLSGKIYDDAVCYSFYPIDLHIPTGIKQIFLDEGVIPTIPYKAMIPKSSQKLLVCGRCIGGDSDSNSAYRVQATCMATGQAAGIAAAIAAKNNISVKDVNHAELLKQLAKQGAIVPIKL